MADSNGHLPSAAATGTTYPVAVDARTRPLPAHALLCAIGITLTACSDRAADESPGQQSPGHPSPGQQSPGHPSPGQAPPGARQVQDVAAEQLVEAILEECHRPLRRRMQRVKVTVTLPDQRRLLIQAELPDKARVSEAKSDYLLRDGEVHRIDQPNDRGAEPAHAIDAQLVRRLVRIVDAASFGPLYRATACQRDGDHFVLTDKAGTKTLLHLHPGTILPSSLGYGEQTVRFDNYLRTKTTWIVNSATLPPLGSCDVLFEDGGILIPAKFFDVPSEADDGKDNKQDPGERVRMTAPGNARERESAAPTLTNGRAARWVLLEPSTDWAMRHAAYEPVHAELVRQNQQIFGFPMLWQEDGERRFAIPFRQRKGGPALAAPPEWQIGSGGATRMLVVYPDSGSVEDRIRTGTAVLERALINRKLKAIGPIIAQPFIHLHRETPSAAKLRACKVRLSVRVQ